MYRVWYWAMIDRESDGRFIASIPDLGDLAAYGDTDKDAVANSALSHVRLSADHAAAQCYPAPTTRRQNQSTAGGNEQAGAVAKRSASEIASLLI